MCQDSKRSKVGVMDDIVSHGSIIYINKIDFCVCRRRSCVVVSNTIALSKRFFLPFNFDYERDYDSELKMILTDIVMVLHPHSIHCARHIG